MVLTRIEERMEVFDLEIAGLKKELSKMLVINASLSEIMKNLELMRFQTEKQQQVLLMFMESNAKERSMMSERLTESAVRDKSTTKGKKNEATSSCDIGADRNIGEGRNERKSDNDENAGDRNKFKKVKMPIFNGEDLDSWLFRVEREYPPQFAMSAKAADHKCKMKEQRELRMFVVVNENEEYEIIEESELEGKELSRPEVKGDNAAYVELSINSVVGLNDLGTMKVRGKLQEEEVVILINCGATHNFVSDKLVKKLQLPTKESTLWDNIGFGNRHSRQGNL
ncbi:histone-lysine N-methyltransferase ASHR1 isoform X3 [Cucumis melo var. makuwa]|uniref:Histone-lysine N-methyltransferase ASHR1 isoform X3 n=1 Tax=Cucumis melo var. makuwa TaxID=1194695 RepID=A0A5D3DSG5_CUCMM|nr:histone-lysine N-methyltransferase ASHR1 isoform X3 [Cucumis melo var. makuwa]TYK26448.1 histone-lysine N-methyltransferase ASHR1 isoform X3 [Cucumis melo var. makuwa]